MSNTLRNHRSPQRWGRSLIELSVAGILLGTLISTVGPRVLQSAERRRAADAMTYLSKVRLAQQQHWALCGSFAEDLSVLDLDQPSPTHFTIGSVCPLEGESLENAWSLSLRRVGFSHGFGDYTVTFTHDGYARALSSVDPRIVP